MDMAVGVDHWTLLACPRCGGTLAPGDELACNACGASYPVVDGLPWLCADPVASLGDWRNRARSLVSALEQQSARYRAAVSPGAISRTAHRRLELLADACGDHARRLKALLAPLEVAAGAAAPETYAALGTPLPVGQGLTSYYANLHRDWCWGAAENEAGFSAVDRALGPGNPGRTLVLGCGGGRLAYDLHVRRRPAVTIAADLNPLMLAIARRMFEGAHVELHEFPLAPRDLASHAVLRELSAPAPAPAGLWPIVADATHAPFATAAFDTIVTPWLVDILDEDFAVVAARVNQWLRPGGRWVNSGSWFFQQPDPARCYSLDELPDLLHAAGFTDVSMHEEMVPYLASPASSQARMERLVTWSAIARSRVPAPPPHRNSPAWLERTDVPLPLLPQLESHVLALRVHAYVASLVDGRRTLAEIAAILANERLMPADEALPAVRAFLQRVYSDAQPAVRP